MSHDIMFFTNKFDEFDLFEKFNVRFQHSNQIAKCRIFNRTKKHVENNNNVCQLIKKIINRIFDIDKFRKRFF